MMYVCKACEKEIEKGMPVFIDEKGNYYHAECAEALPPTKLAILSRIADFAISDIAEFLITPSLMDKIKSTFAVEIGEHGITDDEIKSAVKERMMG